MTPEEEAQTDLVLDIVTDRDRLWPIYRHLFRPSDAATIPVHVMLLWMESRHRGIWTTQLDSSTRDTSMAGLSGRQDGFEAMDAALRAARSVIRDTLSRSQNTSTDGKPGPEISG